MPDRLDTDGMVENSSAIPISNSHISNSGHNNDLTGDYGDYIYDTDVFKQSLSIPVSRSCCSMSMAPSSRDVALASRYGLHIIDLTTPFEPACYLRYETSWDPVEVRWSPHRTRENWVATTSNQRVLIWNVQASPNQPIEVIIPGHKRAISDLHWSPYQTNMIATGALDTDIHLWDLRTPNRPVVSLCAWTAGAARVQYNRKNEFVIASAHADMVKIWDTRKGTAPTTEIAAHDGKINYVDWSLEEENELLTCGQDRKLKIWNVQQPTECSVSITTNAPVRLARYAPFGPAILSAAQRLDPTLRLWSCDSNKQDQLVHTFTGSTEPFRKFGWRIRNDVDDEFQLVALSLDGNLRIYHVNNKITAMCGKQGKSAMAKQRPTHSLKQPISAVMGYRESMHVPLIPIEDVITSYYPVTSVQSYSAGNSTSGSCTPVTGFGSGQTLLGRSYGRSAHLPFDILSSTSQSNYNSNSASLNNFNYGTSPNYKIQTNVSAVFKASPQNTARLSSQLFMNSPHLPKDNLSTNQGVASVASTNLVGDTSDWSLPEEIAMVKRKYPQVQFDKFDPLSRTLSISLDGPWSNTDMAFVHVSLSFPLNYPRAAPDVSVHRSAAIPMAYRSQMIQGLTKIITRHVDLQQPCINSIIMFLLGDHVRMSAQDGIDVEGDMLLLDTHAPHNRLLSGQDRSRVPYPRLCGAVFGSNGRLAIFFSKKAPLTPSLRRPSRLDALFAFSRRGNRSETSLHDMLNSIGLPHGWPRSYDRYEHGSKTSNRHDPTRLRGASSYDEDTDEVISSDNTSRSDKSNCHAVNLFNVSNQLPASRLLASKYKLLGDHPAEVAMENAEVARLLGHDDLCHMWTLASLILEDTLRADETKSPRRLRWGLHPLGRQLVKSLLDYLARLGDIQTLAMFCCVFAEPFPPFSTMNLHQPTTSMLTLGASASMEDSNHTHQALGNGNRDYFTMPTTKTRSPYPFIPAVPAPAPAPAPTSAIPVESSRLSALSYWPGFGLRLSQVPTRDTSISHDSDASHSDTGTTAAATITTTRSPHTHNTNISISGFAPSNLHGPPVMPTTINTTGMAQSYTSEHTAIISPSLMAAITSAVSPAHATESWPNISSNMLPSNRNDSGFKVVTLYNERDFDSETRPRHVSLLDPLHWGQYDCYRLYYAEMLFRWGLLKQRAEILKFVNINAIKRVHAADFEERFHLGFGRYCAECRVPVPINGLCEQCKRRRKGIECVICHVTVGGLVNVCLVCQHGGHDHHIRDWFRHGNVDCPTGCGCICVLACGEFK